MNTDTINNALFIGMVYNADPKKTSFMQAISAAGIKFTTNRKFATNVEWTVGTSTQPAISETASLTGPTPVSFPDTQRENVTQIFQEIVTITRAVDISQGAISGVATVGLSPEETDPKIKQINRAMKKTARDLNFTLINGTFSDAGQSNATNPNKTKGILEAITTNVVDAGTTALDKAKIDELIKDIFDNGPRSLDDTVLFVNSSKKQAITLIYSTAELLQVDRDRFTGGANLTKIVTDFGDVFLMVDNDVPNDTVFAVTLLDEDGRQVIAPIHGALKSEEMMELGEDIPFNVNEPTHLLIKELSQIGGRKFEIYHESGLQHGPEFFHGKIINLT